MELIAQSYLEYKQMVLAMTTELQTLPKGSLTYRTIGGKSYCYLQFRDEENKVRNKIVEPAACEDLQQAIERRTFLKKNIKILQEYISFLEKKYAHLKTVSIRDTTPLAANNAEKPYRTLKGDYVRSKSEVIIANALYNHQISYEYEKPLVLEGCGYTLYPDFTIYTPHKKQVVYWEHCGLMDNEKYRSKWHWKQGIYENYNISEWNHNLIVTYETKSVPLSVELVREGVERLQCW